MIMSDIIDKVLYPDEQHEGFDDRIPYDDVIEGLNIGLCSKSVEKDAADTLDELRRRWKDRQMSKSISA